MKLSCVFTVIMFLLPVAVFGTENNYTVYMLGQKIGTSSEKWETIQHKDGRCFVKLNSSSEMKIMRGTASFEVKTESTVFAECKTFKPVSISTATKEFATGVLGAGSVENDVFKAEITKNNKKETFSYPLEDGLTFFSMVLKKYPPDTLIKGLSKTVISEESLNKVNVSISGNKKGDLYIINVNYSGVPINFHILNGTVIRSELQNGLITYELNGRSEKQKVQSSSNKSSADIIELTAKNNSGIPVKTPRKTISTVFTLKGENLPDIPSNCYQSVEVLSGEKRVTVQNSSFPCGKGNVDKSLLLPNIFEDSDSPVIINAAEKLKKGARNRNDLIEKTLGFVFRHIKNKNYNHGNLSASETFKKRAGDCTEHSTLLSALLKAMGIPVKMVYGIVLDDKGSFFFHNWNEVYTDEGWVAVDSTFGMMRSDSARIVLAYGSGDSASREQVALTVLRFLSSGLIISVDGFSYE